MAENYLRLAQHRGSYWSMRHTTHTTLILGCNIWQFYWQCFGPAIRIFHSWDQASISMARIRKAPGITMLLDATAHPRQQRWRSRLSRAAREGNPTLPIPTALPHDDHQASPGVLSIASTHAVTSSAAALLSTHCSLIHSQLRSSTLHLLFTHIISRR